MLNKLYKKKGVSGTIYVNANSPNLGFPHFNFFVSGWTPDIKNRAGLAKLVGDLKILPFYDPIMPQFASAVCKLVIFIFSK